MHLGQQIHSYTRAYRNRISNALLSGAVIMRAMRSTANHCHEFLMELGNLKMTLV